jgi:hypothetical protein
MESCILLLQRLNDLTPLLPAFAIVGRLVPLKRALAPAMATASASAKRRCSGS